MKRCAPPLAALLVGYLVLSASNALGAPLSYPDDPGYEEFRRSEAKTLEALANNPARALSYRLLLAQRRLREAQLMAVKGKYSLVPPTLNAYQDTIQEALENLKELQGDPQRLASLYKTVSGASQSQQGLLKSLAKRIPPELNPSLEEAMATSRQLREVVLGTSSFPGAPTPKGGITGKQSATIKEPLLPKESALEETQPTTPLGPAATSKVKTLQPAVSQPRTPDDILGHRLRPLETHPRGTRRPGDTHPRPRARDPIRPRDR